MFRKWIDRLKPQDASASLLKLSFEPQPKLNAPAPSVRPIPLETNKSIKGRFIYFTDRRDNTEFIGHPVIFLPGVRHPSIEPWAHNLEGALGIWGNDNDTSGSIDKEKTQWVDDPKLGLFTSSKNHPREVLGCKGSIHGVPYTFEEILQVGKNVVIYKLANGLDRTFSVLGFPRDRIDPLHALINSLHRIVEGKLTPVPSQIIALCDRVLAFAPDDQTALYNKGVFLFADHQFAQAHNTLQGLLLLTPQDQLSALYDSAALAHMGEDFLALDQFEKAHLLSEDDCREHLNSVASLHEAIEACLIRLIPQHERARRIHRKYFPGSADTP